MQKLRYFAITVVSMTSLFSQISPLIFEPLIKNLNIALPVVTSSSSVIIIFSWQLQTLKPICVLNLLTSCLPIPLERLDLTSPHCHKPIANSTTTDHYLQGKPANDPANPLVVKLIMFRPPLPGRPEKTCRSKMSRLPRQRPTRSG